MKKYVVLLLFILFLTDKVIAPQPVFNNDAREFLEDKRKMEFECQQLKMWLDSISYYESGSNWRKYNEFGYIGKYQFGHSALRSTGFDHVSYKEFINNPDIWTKYEQDSAMLIFMKKNEVYLDSIIKMYNDSVFNGILISKSGILAAAHLAGSEGVKNFFLSEGKNDPDDIYGTTLSYYLNKFSGYKF